MRVIRQVAAIGDDQARMRTDLPPIRLRGVRHLAATLIHAGGGGLHTIKETRRRGVVRPPAKQ